MARSRGRPLTSENAALRERIVSAAIDEFARAGFEGARIERVARAAGCSRPLVYFYFRDKQALFAAALAAGAERRAGQMEKQPPSLAEALVYWFEQNRAEPARIRLLMQEALAEGTAEPNAARRAYFERQLDAVRDFQAAGLLRLDIDPRDLLTAILALTTFPAAFPSMAAACLGVETEQALAGRWREGLDRLATLLAPDGAD
jgi:AcrR family transcriptional regulator